MYPHDLPEGPSQRLRALMKLSGRIAEQLTGFVPREVAVGGAANHIVASRLYKTVCSRWDRFCTKIWRRDSSTIRLWREAYTTYCRVLPAPARPLCYSQLLALRGVAPENTLPVWLRALEQCRVEEVTARQIRTIASECGAVTRRPSRPGRASHSSSSSNESVKDGALADVYQAALCCRGIIQIAERDAHHEILQEARRLSEYLEREIRVREIDTQCQEGVRNSHTSKAS